MKLAVARVVSLSLLACGSASTPLVAQAPLTRVAATTLKLPAEGSTAVY